MYTNNSDMEISKGITVDIRGSEIKVKGSKGEVIKNFGPGVILESDGSKIKISTKQKEMINTVKGIIKNMFKGTSEGYTRTMKILFSHFPITLEIKGQQIFIKNFLGEKSPRKTKIEGNVKVSVKGQEVVITGSNKEEVGQTIANIKTATKIRKRDARIFQDGIYLIGE
ncbi:MAG: 50S ribosomal protein L6 [Candidatus ainarchaeum sp.]|nr:50S ribosomal protein L6 [Candidatus ainarchaeum sp.]